MFASSGGGYFTEKLEELCWQCLSNSQWSTAFWQESFRIFLLFLFIQLVRYGAGSGLIFILEILLFTPKLALDEPQQTQSLKTTFKAHYNNHRRIILVITS